MAAIAYPASFSPRQGSQIGRSTRPALIVLEGGRGHRYHIASNRRYMARRVAVSLLFVVTLVVGIPAVASLVDAMGAKPVAAQNTHAEASAGAPATATTASYRVRPGDSLWSIASSIAGTREVRSIVDQLVSLHGSTSIQAGEILDLSSLIQG